jgi:hypothetical protein
MPTFQQSNQVRLTLKMKLANYAWYITSVIYAVADGWEVAITVKKIDNKVRKLVPPVIDGVGVKIEVE